MDLCLPMAQGPLDGAVTLAGDKSMAHRAALFAALAQGVSEIARYPDSGVTRAMRGALASLGVKTDWRDGVLRVEGQGFKPFPQAGAEAYCGHSATTIRLLAGALAATGSQAVLSGSAGLSKRPMDRIVEPLRAMGADIADTAGCAPLRIAPAALKGIDYAVPVASAQVLSCLQLAALGASGPSRFTVPGPVRDHTVRMLAAMGASIASEGSETRVEPLAAPLRPLKGALPGDISSAAFLFVAAALVPGSRVTVRDVGVNPARTGCLDVLAAMGAHVTLANAREEMGEPVADVTLTAAPLKGVRCSGDVIVRAIDEWPALAAAAAFAEGDTVVREAAELRHKETDRIAAVVRQFRALGAEVEEFPDGFRIRGGTLAGGRAEAGGDHRLAMSLALLGLRKNVTVGGAEILEESFPGFAETLASLYPPLGKRQDLS